MAIINDSVLEKSEKIIFALRDIYAKNGFKPYKMRKFEEYDLYAEHKDFLVSDNVITFTDTSGKLMALKPDVTLSIIKNTADNPSVTKKVYYNENVYRVSKGTGSFKEIKQVGVECFGKVSENEICEVLELAAKSLKILSDDAVLTVSDVDIIDEIIEKLSLSWESKKELYSAVSEKNIQEIDRLCADCDDKKSVEILKDLLSLYGNYSDIESKLDSLLGNFETYRSFSGVIKKVSSVSKNILIDFSIVGDINYYNGIIFKGFLYKNPSCVLSGGQYDRLMKKLKRRSGAIGFAVDTDALEHFDENTDKADGFLNIALPKGRLGEKIYDMFRKAGYECPEVLEETRKLIFENKEKGVRYFWVKPSDVAIYVERGAADIGVAGKDILLEYNPEVYELLDLKKGVCKMAVAAPVGFSDEQNKTLRIATKFSNIAKVFYSKKGRDIDIIHLNGSIEIAPILGLSDVIVDIVETGKTLKENNLCVVETVVPISARLIANKSVYNFKGEKIKEVAERLLKVTEDEND